MVVRYTCNIDDLYSTDFGAPRSKVLPIAFMSSKQLAEHGDIHCWYAEMQQWIKSHGISINAQPLF